MASQYARPDTPPSLALAKPASQWTKLISFSFGFRFGFDFGFGFPENRLIDLFLRSSLPLPFFLTLSLSVAFCLLLRRTNYAPNALRPQTTSIFMPLLPLLPLSRILLDSVIMISWLVSASFNDFADNMHNGCPVVPPPPAPSFTRTAAVANQLTRLQSGRGGHGRRRMRLMGRERINSFPASLRGTCNFRTFAQDATRDAN